MKVLVTGGCGFVGSHIVDRLLDRGHEPIVIDDLSSGVQYTRDGVETHHFRIYEATDRLRAIVQRCGGIIHAAAYADLRSNWEDTRERKRLLEANVVATQAMLDAWSVSGGTRKVPFVLVSTASVYGAATSDARVTEMDANVTTIQSPYAASKFACEAMVHAYAHKLKAPWFVARLVNVVGARSTHGVIADFVRKAKTSHIHAEDDGRQRKSWVNVLDVAGALTGMIDGSTPPGVYTVASTERISWWDIIDAMGWPRSRVTWEKRAGGAVGDPVNLHTSNEKLAAHYRFEHSVNDGIKAALEWHGWYTGKGGDK